MSRSSAAMPRVRPKRAAKKEPHSSDGDSTAQGHPLILAMLDNMGEGVAARLLYDTKVGILLNEHVAEDGAAVSEHACRLGAEGIVSKKVDAPYRSGPCRVWIKVRNRASIAVQRERRENWNR